MKRSLAILVAGTLILGGLAIWALWGLAAWTVPEILLAGFALALIGFAISI